MNVVFPVYVGLYFWFSGYCQIPHAVWQSSISTHFTCYILQTLRVCNWNSAPHCSQRMVSSCLVTCVLHPELHSKLCSDGATGCRTINCMLGNYGRPCRVKFLTSGSLECNGENYFYLPVDFTWKSFVNPEIWLHKHEISLVLHRWKCHSYEGRQIRIYVASFMWKKMYVHVYYYSYQNITKYNYLNKN